MSPFEFINTVARSTGFLSRLPVPARFFAEDNGRMEETPAGFAVSGLIVAVPAALVLYGAGLLHAPLLAAALSIAVMIATTGALHEDGLADTADGLGGGKSREWALDIMKDSRIGAYGALALGASLLIRAGALMALLGKASPGFAAFSLIACAGLSRAAMVWHWRSLRPAKSDGVAARLGVPETGSVVICGITGVVAALVLLLPSLSLPAVTVTIMAGLGATYLFTLHVGKRLGGHTGDTLGATQQISDMVMLSVLALLAGTGA